MVPTMKGTRHQLTCETAYSGDFVQSLIAPRSVNMEPLTILHEISGVLRPVRPLTTSLLPCRCLPTPCGKRDNRS